jgi:hypothetical protein
MHSDWIWWSKLKASITFIIIFSVDIGLSISVPRQMRMINEATKDLKLCGDESGFSLYSTECDGILHKTSLFAWIMYAVSILFSIGLLILSAKTSNIDLVDGDVSKLLDFNKIIIIFFLRNIMMFNLMNYVSVRRGDDIIVTAVRMETDAFIRMIVGGFFLAILLSMAFPSQLIQRFKAGFFFNTILYIVMFVFWFVVSSSTIYYIGATNVLDRNVLTMYDLRGPRLSTLNYWNYGILLIIYSEFIVLLELIGRFRKINNEENDKSDVHFDNSMIQLSKNSE